MLLLLLCWFDCCWTNAVRIPHSVLYSVHSTFILSIIHFMVVCVLSQSRFVLFSFFSSSLSLTLSLTHFYLKWEPNEEMLFFLNSDAHFIRKCVFVCVHVFVDLIRFDIRLWFSFGTRSARPVSDCHQKWMFSASVRRQSVAIDF